MASLPLKYDASGLICAVIQDSRTGRVLMVGYMDEVALQRTRRCGRVTFWSRSRRQYWCKGETSGNFLQVESIQVDCDGDALLIQAIPAGPTCHTGSTSCFDSGGEVPLPGPTPGRPALGPTIEAKGGYV